MMFQRSRPFWVSFAVVITLNACVAPTNEYDPATPQDEQRPAALSGVVRDVAEAGVFGAEVVVDDTTTTTDEDGAFAFSLAPGDVQVRVRHPAYVPEVSSVSLSPGEELAVDFVLTPLPQETGDDVGHLFGLVHRAGQLSLPEDEQDHAGVVVEVAGAGVRTVSNPAGVFDLFLQPGTYSLSFTTSGHTEVVVDDVEVVAGADTEVVGSPFVLQGIPGSVRGEVRLEGGGVADNVAIDLAGGGSGVTDPTGAFVVSDIAAGSYLLTATREGFDAHVFGFVEVRAGQETTLPAFVLELSRGSVSGVVQLAGQDDASGVFIDVGGGQGAAVTSTDGRFVVNNVREGSYALSARKEGYVVSVVNDVEVVADENVDVGTLTLAPQQGDFDLAGGALFTATNTVSVAFDTDGVVEYRVSEDPNFADAALGDTDFVAVGDPVEHTLSSPDGLKTVYAEVRDADGLSSGLLSAQITLDTTAPVVDTISLDSGAAATNAANGLVSVALAATDATSGVSELQISNDTTFDEPFVPYTTSTTHTLADVESDGEKTVYVRVRDFAGNVSDAVSSTITLDTVPPSATSFSIGCGLSVDAVACGSPIVSLHVTTDDAVAMAVSNEAGVPNAVFKAFASTSTHLLNPGDGTQTVYLQLRDAAGNVSNVFSDDVVVDSVAPSLPSVALAGGAMATSSPTVTLALSAVGATQMQVAFDGVLDDESTVPYASAAVGELPGGEGQKRVAARFFDDAGNESAIAVNAVLLDTTAPIISSVSLDDGAAATNANDGVVSLAVNATDDGAGVSELQVSNDDIFDELFTAFSTLTSHTLTDLATEGDKTVYVRVRDAAGNVSVPVSSTITFDTVPPSLNVFTIGCGDAVDAAACSGSVVSLHVDSPDATEMAVSNNAGLPGAVFAPFASTTTHLLAPGDGPQTVYLQLRDAAGNVSNTFSDDVTVDTVAPSLPSIALANGGFATSSRTVTLALSAVGATQMRVAFDGVLDNAPTVPYATSATGDLPAGDGDKPVVAVFLDDAGNESAAVQATVALDTTAPSAPLTTTNEVTVNADAFIVYLAANSRSADDPNFSHYELATSSPLRTTPFVPTALLDGFNFILDAGDDGGCTAPCTHQLQVRAVDAAGNVSGATEVTVHEDSTFPTAPRLTPRGARISSLDAPMRLEERSNDNGVDTEVVGYEVLGGAFEAWTAVTPTEVYSYALDRRDFSHELCIRGRDAAGNVSPSDCVVIEQQSSVFITTTAADEEDPTISGDIVAYVSAEAGLMITNVDRSVEAQLDPYGTAVRLDGDSASTTVVWARNFDGARVYQVREAGDGVLEADFLDKEECFFRTEAGDGIYRLDSVQNLDVDGDDVVAYGVRAGVEGIFHTDQCFTRATDAATRLTLLPLLGQSFRLCEADGPTAPRVKDGVVVWCEDNNGEQSIHRYVLASESETVIATNVQPGPEGDAHQPVVTEDAIYWGSGESICRLGLVDPVTTPYVGCPEVLQVVAEGVHQLSGADGSRVAYSSGGNGVQLDAAYYNHDTGTTELLTDDILDQLDVDVWRDRVVYADRRRFNEDIVVRDLTEAGFLVAHPAIQAVPATDGRYVVWGDTRAGLGLQVHDLQTHQARRLTPDNEVLAVGDEVFSLANGKVAYAVYAAYDAEGAPDVSGGTRLYVHDIATDDRFEIDDSAQAIETPTLNETATRLVWFDPAVAPLQTSALLATGEASGAIGRMGAAVTEVHRMGVVGDTVVYIDSTGGGNNPVKCAVAGAVVSVELSDANADARDVGFAAVDTVGPTAVWSADGRVYRTWVDCQDPHSFAVETLSFSGESPNISASGYVVWMSNGAYDGLGRVAVRDLLQEQTFKLNANLSATGDDSPSFDPYVFGDRVVWSGFAFGNSDIFMARFGEQR